MPRIKNDNHKDSKATKIAFSVLGKPANLDFKRSPAQERLNRELLAQETSRVR